MFIKTALAFVLILFTTNTMIAGSQGRAKKKMGDSEGKCIITEFHKEKDTLFAQAMVYKLDEKECADEAKLGCSLLTLRVEYVWEKSPKQTIECEVKK